LTFNQRADGSTPSGLTKFLLAALTLAAAGASHAQPQFSIPIDCEIGKGCLVQNYADRDPGPGIRDFACGSMSYDGHKGTDFRIRDLTVMRRGVAVLAAAPGSVAATRDGVDDVSIREGGQAKVKGLECGNGVLLDHGGGWVTQYCHLRKGSVLVKQGDRVDTGARLGLVGLSGMTEFPHVHFEVRKDDTPIDPYTSQPVTARGSACAPMGRHLWTAQAAERLGYPGAAFLAGGFTDRPVDFAALENAPPPEPGLASPALVAFVRVAGVRAGDLETLEITGPNGQVFSKVGPEPLAATKVNWMRFSGRRMTGERLTPGRYSALYRLQRGGETLIERRFSIELTR
jgi:murein DD-endopeptidase MepM/ murein hydrolase activator NlpD